MMRILPKKADKLRDLLLIDITEKQFPYFLRKKKVNGSLVCFILVEKQRITLAKKSGKPELKRSETISNISV